MKKLTTLSFLAFILSIISCSDNSNSLIGPTDEVIIDNNPKPIEKQDIHIVKLKVYKATEREHAVIPNAKVFLYESNNFKKDPITEGVTDINGLVTFTEKIKKDKRYYYRISADSCYSNNIFKFFSELSNVKKFSNFSTKSVTIDKYDDKDYTTKKYYTDSCELVKTGYIKVYNKSLYDYKLYIHPDNYGVIKAKETLNFPVKIPKNKARSLFFIETEKGFKNKTLKDIIFECGNSKEVFL